MVYSAKTQRILLFGLFLLMIQAMILNKNHPEMFFFLVPATIVTLATVFVRFHFSISCSGSLIFQIRLFHFIVYKREVRYIDIVRMTFMRVGWGKRCVIVHTRKGLNLRISNFNPLTVYDDLMTFANRYHILVYKTKDYTHLDKAS